jgi:hypothetical protein
MVQEAVLGSVALGLQCSEQCLFGSQNLNCRGRIFRQVGQAASMRDQASTDDFPNEGSQIRGDDAHFRDEIAVQGFAVVSKADDSFSERGDIFHVRGRNFLAHTRLCRVDDAPCDFFVVLHNLGEIMQAVV